MRKRNPRLKDHRKNTREIHAKKVNHERCRGLYLREIKHSQITKIDKRDIHEKTV